MSALPYSLWRLLLLYHGDVLTDGADVVWGIGGDTGVVGISGAEIRYPEVPGLPVGGIGGTGIELQAVLLPLGDVGGGTGHGRPGQFCGETKNMHFAQKTRDESIDFAVGVW